MPLYIPKTEQVGCEWPSRAPFPYPLLSVCVFQVVDVTAVPVDADAQQGAWEETVLRQDHKVGEEAAQSLQHAWRSYNKNNNRYLIL